jgi:hypothetical protein
MHNNLHILFLQSFLFTYDTFTSLDDNYQHEIIKWKLWTKSSNIYPLCIWRKEMYE